MHRNLNASTSPLTRSFPLLAALLIVGNASAQKAAAPRVDYHLQEARFRSRSLLDENGQMPSNAWLNAVQQKKQMSFDANAWPGAAPAGAITPNVAGIDSASWAWLGPGNIGGRIRSILVNPTNASILYAGGVGGGVWKSTSAGASWFPLNDFMGNLAIGSMLMDPANPNVIYAGTGEGSSNADALRGAGIFKTTDAGTNWTQLPSTANSSFYFVNRLSVSPASNLILLAATGTGIWRSTDAGSTWSQRYSAVAMLDVVFNPADGTKAIASGSTFGVIGLSVYSTDGGLTWFPSTGLPASGGRVEVAYAASNPSIVFASANNNSGEVYRSTDGGVSFTLMSNPGHVSGQGWYDNCIWVDPTNPNLVLIGGTDIYRSVDGGSTFSDIGGYIGGIHPDQHAIVNTPAYNGTTIKTVFIGNDGGLFKATDISTVTPGSGWSTLNNNLGITQFYGAAGNNSSGTIVGGTQDNGTDRYTTAGGPQGYTSMYGGDGGFCAADQSDPNYFYGEYVHLQIHRSSNGGASSSYITSGLGDAGVPGGGGDPDGQGPDGDPDASANFIAPFILDPNNFNTLLAGGSNLWRSVNVKAPTPSWTNIKPGVSGSFISAIAVARGNSDIIWVGHNNGNLFSTTNGTAANPFWTRRDLGSPSTPARTCTRLAIDPNNYDIVYATYSGFNSDNVYRTANSGTNWANIAAGLPVAPVRSLVIAPFNSSYLYVGTDVGVFASTTSGSSWSTSNDGAANVAVDELFWMNNYLVAATHGRGLFRILVSPYPVVNLFSATLASESCPPGNGVIDPGETVTMNFTLTNISAVSTTNLTATLLVTNGVVSPSGPQNYGALVRGGAPVTKSFSFMATGQCGGTISATLQLVDGATNLGTISASFPLGVPNQVFSQNFDSVTPPALPAGWTISSGGPFWYTTNGASDTIPNSAFAPEPTVPSDDSLVSPVFSIATTLAQVTFRHNFQTEPSYDGGVVEISISGGAFNDIISAGGSFVLNGYNQVIANTDSALVGRNTWSGSSGGFITTKVNLPPAAAGHTVQLRWRFATDTGNSTPSTGWFVDTITVSDGATCCASIPRPVFTSVSRAGTSVNLTWSATAGVNYRLQYNTNLAGTNWTAVAGDVLAGGSTASKTDSPATNAARFYRVLQLP
jgi:photosystem II stability/assembly factor-like uncharacterized protein